MSFVLGAFAVIFDDEGDVLLCHRRDLDVWNLPGGALEGGELPDEAVVREVREETGLEVAVERLVGIYGKFNRDEIVFVFECRITKGIPSTTNETRAIKYFGLGDLPKNTIPKHVERIQDTYLKQVTPIIKRQTLPSTIDFLSKDVGNP